MKPVMQACVGSVMLGLAGCGSIPVYNVEYNDTYLAGETKAVPDVSVVVRGDPFGVSKAEFDNSVVNAMQGWSGSSDRFTATGDPNSAYRVIMVFNPVSNSYTNGICDRPISAEGVSGAPSPATVPIAAALCRGETYLSYVSGTVATAGGPNGADFRDGVGTATRYLFPVQNPVQRNNHGCDRC